MYRTLAFLLLRVVPLASVLCNTSRVVRAASLDSYSVKESIRVPRNWVIHGDPLPTQNIILSIALPQPNFGVLEQQLYEISDPTHTRYGQHLSKVAVESIVAPAQESVDAVDKWFETFNVTTSQIVRSPAKDWVTATLPIGLVQQMLNTTYHVWRHTQTGHRLVRTTHYSLPKHLHQHIDLIQPTTMFGRFRKPELKLSEIAEGGPASTSISPSTVSKLPVGHVDPSCNQTITVTCLQQIYNAVGFKPSSKANSIGVTGFLDEFANKNDLQTFFRDQRPDAVNSTFKFTSVNGGLNNQSASEAGPEANLDVQFAFGLVFPIESMFWSTAGEPPFIPDSIELENGNEPYSQWLNFVLSHPNPPLTISTSYGDNEETVPQALAERLCAGFAQLGARGVSLIFGSGDSGVGDGNPDPTTQDCFTNDGSNRTVFIPNFPASCPYVTTVGATTLFNPEVAISRFFSGGGFSNYFPRPNYQEDAVSNYLESQPKDLYKGLFNRDGRAYPDVASQSDFFKIIIGGRAFLVGGGSAATPTFAAFIALLNDVRLSAKKPALGFLNPFIYSVGFQGLNDITAGHNSGCGTSGFNATAGWDPGFGSPNFAKLREIVLGV